MRILRSIFAAAIAPLLLGLATTAATANGKGAPAPYAPLSFWQGLYGGLHLGHADADFDDGLVGGAQLGFNWQAGPVVYGLEADISAADGDDIELLASGRGRLGYLILPNVLIYGTAGVGLVSGSDTESGFVYGLGVEGAFTDGMSARLEYLAYDIDGNSDSVDVIRAGLNFKLGR